MTFYRRRGKRVLDATAAGIGLVLILPLLALVALAVLFALGRPVLFSQVRPGIGGRPFRLYKFRTMREAPADHDAPDEARLTRFGRALRSSSMDELPELFNVLRGEMSLVGPRPLLLEYLPLYSPEQQRRHEVRPGLTGWAQINGRNATTWADRLRLDVWYVDNVSLALDIRILARTLFHVSRQTGIAQEGHATMERFRGQT
jgi:lipopolysaccharide/colanic/teichoic acid biosynthesis glycosyltransferase